MSNMRGVLERYSRGAKELHPELCCAVSYDPRLLERLPPEIVERDYGCGDPSRYVRAGDVVLDLGSGSGKMCYIAAQLVGEGGRVVGVDMNDDMLALARKYQADMARTLGGDRVEFMKARIQDLALDLDAVDRLSGREPRPQQRRPARAGSLEAQQRRERPLIPDGSVDLVVSNCVLNLVDDAAKPQLIREIFRVLKPGGRTPSPTS